MNKKQASSIIENTFNKAFNRDKFISFAGNLFNLRSTNYSQRSVGIFDTYKQHVKSLEVVAKFSDGKNEIDVLIITLIKDTSLDKARTMQRNFVARYLSEKQGDAAIVAFTSPDAQDWRFSLIKMDYKFKATDTGIKVEQEVTPAKRWSFLVGKNENSHTAQSQLVGILANDEVAPTLDELEQAFSIETVTNEFFAKYTDLFLRMKEALDVLLENDSQLKSDFKDKEIDTADFAKKTMGQMAFLYFLQKKGWFGVAPDKEWGTGVKNFLREIFERRNKYGENFFDDVLEPLFYEALAQDRGNDAIYPKLNNCRMPFLNGGLFEPMNGYSWETTHIRLPDELFSNDTKTKEGDIGDGILDVFDRYNFTVNESEPLEQEVAVDPEMLGKVFENLLEIKDRKSKGAFYTPREIVHYMCQESLINYLETETNSLIPKVDIESFIQQGSQIIQNDKSVIEQGGDKDSLLLPKSISDQSERLDDLLANIKVCDPAVGSGAFPLGMLNEIVTARTILGIHLRNNPSAYNLKLHAISNSIYGVDIDPGAIEIAKLRFWLSLVVEEDNPTPLPNIEHKIMQGNSLVSQYEGIELFDDDFLNSAESDNNKKNEIQDKLDAKQKEYFSLHSEGELTVVKKSEIEEEIKRLRRRQKFLNNKHNNSVETGGLFDTDQAKKIAQQKAKLLQSKIAQYVTIDSKTNKENLKKEIDHLKWDLIEATLEERGETGKLDEIKKLRKDRVKPFFIWKLEFGDVFKNNGGFDVVIGNPPYIMEDENKNAFNNLHHHSCYQGKTDIWHLFTGSGLDIVREKGVLTYIAKNQWLCSASASNMREEIYRKSNLKKIVDFGVNMVFENASQQTMIVTLEKNLNNESHCIEYLKFAKPTKLKEIKRRISENFKNLDGLLVSRKRLPKDYSKTENLTFSSIEKEVILNKIDAKKNFEFNQKVEIIQGIIGGPDKAFTANKEELSNFTHDEKKYIKMLHTSTGKFYTPDTDKYIFYIHRHNFNSLDDCPNIKNQLIEYQEKLVDRREVKKNSIKWFHLWWPRDEKFFVDGAKIVFASRTKGRNFSFTTQSFYGSRNLFFIKSDRVNLKYIVALLNSKLMCFYMDERLKHTGDLLQLDKNQFIKIPLFTPDRTQDFEKLVDKIIENKKMNGSAKRLEAQIDQLVYQLYDLTDEEISVVEKTSD